MKFLSWLWKVTDGHKSWLLLSTVTIIQTGVEQQLWKGSPTLSIVCLVLTTLAGGAIGSHIKKSIKK